MQRLCAIPLTLEPPRASYMHGWGEECLGAKPIICSWTLIIHDVRGKPTNFTFDLVHGRSPLILGMDVRAHCNTFNLSQQRYIELKRPTDKEPRYLFTYVVSDDQRLRLEISPHPKSKVSTLLGNIHTTARRKPLVFCKKIHRYTHASKAEMLTLCKQPGILDKNLTEAIEKVTDACEACAKNGRPIPRHKVSLTHVNQAFNQDLQVDFFFFDIKSKKDYHDPHRFRNWVYRTLHMPSSFHAYHHSHPQDQVALHT